MSTARKALMPLGDSTTRAEHDAPGMGWWGKVLMARPDFVASGPSHNVWSGPLGTTTINMFLGDSRSYNAGTNGITIEGTEAALATKISGASFPPTHFLAVLGLNNALGGDSGASMLTKLDSLLAAIHAAVPAGKIIVMKIANQLYNTGGPKTAIDAYNAGIPTVVAGRSAYTNYGTMPSTLQTWHFSDLQLVHQNSWAEVLMADAVVAAMTAAGW